MNKNLRLAKYSALCVLIIIGSLEVVLFTAVFLRIDKKFDFTCKKIFLFQTVFLNWSVCTVMIQITAKYES